MNVLISANLHRFGHAQDHHHAAFAARTDDPRPQPIASDDPAVARAHDRNTAGIAPRPASAARRERHRGSITLAMRRHRTIISRVCSNSGATWEATAPMVVHCWAGISRSTAASYILMCDRLDHVTRNRDRRRDCANARAHAYPNRLMVQACRRCVGPRLAA